MGRASAPQDTAPGIALAEEFIVAGNFAAAENQLRTLMEASPENASYRYEYALFCYLNSDFLLHEATWSHGALTRTVQENMHHARNLQPGDYDRAVEYARILIDEGFFGANLPHGPAVEAWELVLTLADARYLMEPDWYNYPYVAAQALLHLARIESRFGRPDAARQYLDRIPAIAPDFRIPEDLVEKNTQVAAR